MVDPVRAEYRRHPPERPSGIAWGFDVVTDSTRVRVVPGYGGGLYRAGADWCGLSTNLRHRRASSVSPGSGRTLDLVTDDEPRCAARP